MSLHIKIGRHKLKQGPNRTLLSVEQRCCRAWCRNRVRVPMNKPPSTVLQSEYAGHAQSYRDQFLAVADFGSPPLHLNDAREIIGSILCGIMEQPPPIF